MKPKARILINGFGRIGRAVTRILYSGYLKDQIELAAINANSSGGDLKRMLCFDSVHGRWQGPDVEEGEGFLKIDNDKVDLLWSPDMSDVSFDELGIDVVLECSGKYKDRSQAVKFLEAGARKVLISAPAKDPDRTIVLGVNDDHLLPSDLIVSAASCTTNCVAPLLSCLHKELGVVRGMMTTIHAYTSDQRLLDGSHKDPRRGRAAGLSIVPSRTGATKSIGQIIPELDGLISGQAMRVPVANVSCVDLVVEVISAVGKKDLDQIFLDCSNHNMQSILGYNDLELVSSDFSQSSYSAIYDQTISQCQDQNLHRVVAWYDNEWGFSHRMLDLAAVMAA